MEARPALWDTRLNIYSDTDEKAKSWLGVYQNVIPNLNELSKEDHTKVVYQLLSYLVLLYFKVLKEHGNFGLQYVNFQIYDNSII